jgi:hypothetical protein
VNHAAVQKRRRDDRTVAVLVSNGQLPLFKILARLVATPDSQSYSSLFFYFYTTSAENDPTGSRENLR